MNNQQLHEILKAFAYGSTPEHVADVEEINIDEAKNIFSENKSKIAEIRKGLTSGGYVNERN